MKTAKKTTKRKTKAEANGRKPRKERVRQAYLDPAMAPPHVPAIEDAADEVAELFQARREAADAEGLARDKLLGLMHEHSLREYEYGDRIVRVDGTEKVSVKKAARKESE